MPLRVAAGPISRWVPPSGPSTSARAARPAAGLVVRAHKDGKKRKRPQGKEDQPPPPEPELPQPQAPRITGKEGVGLKTMKRQAGGRCTLPHGHNEELPAARRLVELHRAQTEQSAKPRPVQRTSFRRDREDVLQAAEERRRDAEEAASYRGREALAMMYGTRGQRRVPGGRDRGPTHRPDILPPLLQPPAGAARGRLQRDLCGREAQGPGRGRQAGPGP